ncbi:MAG TPA: diphosphomevalonate decarboxylase [Candidatus Atopostipes pullistercoris]|uniref:diphosphomevalonate decarboxylase n=1 Tax=Candidatus Atopostipes pullistercoris TaxID=2838467 RepID=A0A9D2JYZ4_9LACT|nr:diphosphomevalonate decarboxylase [Candidatus Atopostipes pullistercoris]
MIKQSKWVRAHTNIAFIKYWGKEDETLILPKNNSLSLTLDAFYTDTQVCFDKKLNKDILFIDGEEQDKKALKKAQVILDLVRKEAGIHEFARIDSKNHVPTAAGLASSASGLAALAGAASLAAGLNLTKEELSRLARRGSGSASRSIYGGFAEWQKGSSDIDSFAIPIDEADWDIGMIFIIVDDGRKEVSSTEGMRRVVETSPYYDGWISSTKEDLIDMKSAIKMQDIVKVGEIAERSALKMHALNLSANPPFNYWSPESIEAMRMVSELRKQGYPVYLTMDAGPNVKLICKASQMEELMEKLLQTFHKEQLVMAKPGPGIQILED